MKKYIALSLLLMCVVCTGCDKFLDIKPVGKVIPAKTKEFRELLTGAYNKLPQERGVLQFRSDLMRVSTDEYDQASYGYLDIWNDEANKTNSGMFSFDWKNYYYVIYLCNQIIESQNRMQGKDETAKKEVVGEAYLLRAYTYYLLVNTFGHPYTEEGAKSSLAVPLVLDTDIETVKSRNSVEEIYESILKDIASARQLITQEKWEAAFSYRFNKTSVEAFAARIYLYMGDWQKALEEAKMVIEGNLYQLEDLNVKEPVLPNLYTSKENICALETVMTNGVNRAAIPLPAFLKKYNEHDKRLPLYFGKHGDSQEYNNFVKAGRDEYRTTFRLGEFVITAAEAATQLGQLDEARKYINMLVEKRYDVQGVKEVKDKVSAMSKDGLLAFIYDERARELAGEGHRWFDLRRTTRPEISKEKDKKTYILHQDDNRYTVPIPYDALHANGKLSLQ